MAKNQKISGKQLKAFSLVEISIVLVILGLLTTGAIQGSSLLSKARLYSARNKTKNSPIIHIPDLTFWIESTYEESFAKPNPNNGETISFWRDINPHSSAPLDLDIVSTTPPTYISNGINSLPNISFNNNTNILSKSNVAASQLFSFDQITIFFVGRQYATDNNSQVFKWRSDSSASYTTAWLAWTNQRIYFDFGIWTSGVSANRTVSGAIETKLPRIFCLIKNSNSATIYDRGRLMVTNNIASATIPIQEVGLVSVGERYSGQIGEIITFSRALNNEERQSVESYLSQKWKIGLQQ